MAKRLTFKQKEEILTSFADGKTIEELSKEFDCSKLTISRNLKKNFSENEYKELVGRNESRNSSLESKHSENKVKKNLRKKIDNKELSSKKELDKDEEIENTFQFNAFTEIIPLDQEIDNVPRKDLSSLPIADMDFPKTVFMIVDKAIELETKLLKDYPEWGFLSEIDLNRKTIEIFSDLKIAKRSCNNNQKVIRVPNTNVFKIVAPLLVLRGISRIISEDKLIAL